MCQSWLHFLMHHQQMWLLWVPFHGATPLSAEFSPLHSLSKPSMDWVSPTHTLTHSPTQTPSPHLLLPLLFPSSPRLVLQTHASTCLFLWFSLNLFHILTGRVISGSSVPGVCIIRKHFMSNYSLVKYHKRVALWEIWTASEKSAYPPPNESSLNILWQLFPCGCALTKITPEGEFKK